MRMQLLGTVVLGMWIWGGCTGDTGSLSVVMSSEDSLRNGLFPDGESESIEDGWTVRFDRYVANVGMPTLTDSEGASFVDSKNFVVDLTQIGEGGEPLFAISELEGKRYAFGYTISPDPTPEKSNVVDEDDYQRQIENDFTFQVAGTLEHPTGQSCPPARLATPGDKPSNGQMNAAGDPCFDAPNLTFSIDLKEQGVFGPCEIDGSDGVAIPADAVQTVSIVLHGDHLFYNGFVDDEDLVSRLVQWMADCDLDLDGNVTQEELLAVAPSDLSELDSRYELASSPLQRPLANMIDYLSAQAATQGHYQGEGECAYREL